MECDGILDDSDPGILDDMPNVLQRHDPGFRTAAGPKSCPLMLTERQL